MPKKAGKRSTARRLQRSELEVSSWLHMDSSVLVWANSRCDLAEHDETRTRVIVPPGKVGVEMARAGELDGQAAILQRKHHPGSSGIAFACNACVARFYS